MKSPSPKQLKEFEDWGKEPPKHEGHGADSWEHPISERLKQAKCWNWRQEGSLLKCDTDFGPFAQTIPTNYILTGEKDGLPIFKQM